MATRTITVTYCLEGKHTSTASRTFEVNDSDPLETVRTVSTAAGDANMQAMGKLMSDVMSKGV